MVCSLTPFSPIGAQFPPKTSLMNASRLAIFLAGLLSLLAPATLRAVIVSFARDDYVVLQGDSICLDVVIRFEPGDPGTPDLFSYGVRVAPSSIVGLSVDSIDVPAELNFNGFAPGALKDLDPNVIGVKGNVRVPPGAPYTGVLIATFELTFQALGQFVMDLALFEILGPSEDVFLTGNGITLDDVITFAGATVSVVESIEITEVVQPEISLPSFPAPFAPGAGVEVRFRTAYGLHYILQTSLDLIHWTDVGPVVIGDGCVFEFVHLDAGSALERFYRVIVTAPGP